MILFESVDGKTVVEIGNIGILLLTFIAGILYEYFASRFDYKTGKYVGKQNEVLVICNEMFTTDRSGSDGLRRILESYRDLFIILIDRFERTNQLNKVNEFKVKLDTVNRALKEHGYDK